MKKQKIKIQTDGQENKNWNFIEKVYLNPFSLNSGIKRSWRVSKALSILSFPSGEFPLIAHPKSLIFSLEVTKTSIDFLLSYGEDKRTHFDH